MTRDFVRRDLGLIALCLAIGVGTAWATETLWPTPKPAAPEVTPEPVAAITLYAPRVQTAPVEESGPDLSAIPLEEDLALQLVEACEDNGVALALALAVIEQESGFDPQAVNPVSGCYGPMQLNPDWFPAGLSPADNIATGVAYLGGLLKTYGDEGHALTAYYYGPTDLEYSWYSAQALERAKKWEELVS